MKSAQVIFELNARMVMIMVKMKFQVSGSQARQSLSESFPVFMCRETEYLKDALVGSLSHRGEMEAVWIQPFHRYPNLAPCTPRAHT